MELTKKEIMEEIWEKQNQVEEDIRKMRSRLQDPRETIPSLQSFMSYIRSQRDSINTMIASALKIQCQEVSTNSVDGELGHSVCKVFDENHETIEELKDEREELTAAKVDTGPENLAHYVFDEMFQPVPVSPKSDASSFGKSEMPPLPLKSGAQLMNKDEESFPSNMEARDVVAATATGNKIKINSCQNKINSVEGKLEMKSSVHSPGGITYEKSVDPANATPTMFHRSTEPIPTDSQTFPEKFDSFSAIEEAEFSSNETGNQWMEKPAVICPSKLDVPKVAYHVFDESTEPVPTGLQSSFSSYKSLEAIFISNEAGNYLYNEEGQLQSLKLEGSIKHHSGNDGYEPLSEVILVVFDPGGSSLYRMGCHSFNTEDDTIRVGRLQSRELSWEEGLNESVSLSLVKVYKNTKPCTTAPLIGMRQRCSAMLSENTKFVVRIIPTATFLFSPAKLIPSRNNVRACNQGGSPQETPRYNSSILEDLFLEENAEFMRKKFLESKDFREALMLLKVWARQRSSMCVHDCLNGFLLSVIVAYVARESNRVNNSMDAMQIFRVTLNFIANSMTRIDFPAKYDYCIRLNLKGNADVSKLGFCLDDECWTSYEQKVLSLMEQGLKDRAKFVRVIWRNTDCDFNLEDGLAVFGKEALLIGISTNVVEESLKLVTIMGPIPEEKDKALEFRKFWGDKATLRQFLDSRIAEVVVWEQKDWSRHLTIKDMTEWFLSRHLGLLKEDIPIVVQLDFSLLLGKKDPMAFSKSLLKAFSKRLRLLDDIPLSISSVQPLNAGCFFLLVVANFVWDPGQSVIFIYILEDKDVFEGKEERREAKKIMGYDNGLSRLSRDNKVVIMRRKEELKPTSAYSLLA